jgi:hypothetical protein
MSRCAGCLPDVPAALAFGSITTMLNRTAFGLPGTPLWRQRLPCESMPGSDSGFRPGIAPRTVTQGPGMTKQGYARFASPR